MTFTEGFSMASFHDILIEVMDTVIAQDQLKKIESDLQGIINSSKAMPQQIKTLKDWLEQQKKEEEKKKGISMQTTLNNQNQKTTVATPTQQSNSPFQQQENLKAIDQLRITNLTKK